MCWARVIMAHGGKKKKKGKKSKNMSWFLMKRAHMLTLMLPLN